MSNVDLGAARAAAEVRLARQIVVLSLVFFAGAVPLLPTNDLKVAGTLLSGIILAVGAYGSVRTQERIGRTRLDLPALVFLLIATLATIFSVNPFVSFFPSPARGDGLLVYLVYVPMGLAAARLTRPERCEVLTGLLAAGALVGAISILQYYGLDVTRWFGNTGLHYNRSWGTLANPVFLGGYIVLVLPLGLALAAQEPGRRWLGYAATSVLLYAALVGSETRAAWFATAVAAACLLKFLPRAPHTYKRLALLALVFAAVTAVLMLTRPQISLEQRALSAFDPADSSLHGRLFVWEHTLPLIQQRPILGWGFSTLLGRLPGVGSPEYFKIFGNALAVLDTTHNDILQWAFNIGLAGLAAYLWVWATALGTARTALRTTAPGVRPEPGFLAGLVAYFLWLQLAWSHIGPTNVFWLVIGLAAGTAGTRPGPRAHSEADTAP